MLTVLQRNINGGNKLQVLQNKFYPRKIFIHSSSGKICIFTWKFIHNIQIWSSFSVKIYQLNVKRNCAQKICFDGVKRLVYLWFENNLQDFWKKSQVCNWRRLRKQVVKNYIFSILLQGASKRRYFFGKPGAWICITIQPTFFLFYILFHFLKFFSTFYNKIKN